MATLYRQSNYQQHYSPRVVARAGGLPSMAQIQAPQVSNAGAMVFKFLDDFMRTAGPIMGRAYMAQQEGRITDAVIKAKSEFQNWQAEYQKTNRGSLAQNAAADYAQKYSEIVNQTVTDFDGSKHEIFEDQLKRRLAIEGLGIVNSGLKYQARQSELYENSVHAADEERLVKAAAASYDDPGLIAVQIGEYEKSLHRSKPGIDHTAHMAKVNNRIVEESFNAAMANGDYENAQRIIDTQQALINRGSRLGESVARFESSNLGVTAVGRSKTDGTAYGKYQLATLPGSLQEWLAMLTKMGGEHAEIAKRLQAAGHVDSPEFEAAYVKEAQANPKLIEESQYQYILKTKYQPSMAALNPELRQIIEKDAGLRDALWSTAVQHGQGGAPKIWNSVWRPGMSRDELIDAVYDKRGTQFQSSPPNVQQAQITRFKEEREVVRNTYGGIEAAQLLRMQAALNGKRHNVKSGEAAEMENTLKNFAAGIRAGQNVQLPYTQEEMVKTLGVEKGNEAWKSAQEQLAFGEYARAGAYMTSADRMKLLQTTLPVDVTAQDYQQKLVLHGQLQGYYQSLDAELAKDPAAYFMKYDAEMGEVVNDLATNLNPQTAQAFLQKTRELQRAHNLEGVPMFSEQTAALFSHNIENSKDPVALLNNLRVSFGTDYPQVIQALGGKLAPEYQIIGTGMSDAAGRLLVNSLRDPEFDTRIGEIFQAKEIVKTDFDLNVSQAMEEVSQSFRAGGNMQMSGALLNSVSRLAKQYVATQGIEWQAAVEKAKAEVIDSRYSVKTQGERPAIRIPKNHDADLVERGFAGVLASLQLSELKVAELPGFSEADTVSAFRNMLQRGGYWVTNEDESGAYLFFQGRAVPDSKGNAFFKSFADLARAGQNAPESGYGANLSGIASGMNPEVSRGLEAASAAQKEKNASEQERTAAIQKANRIRVGLETPEPATPEASQPAATPAPANPASTGNPKIKEIVPLPDTIAEMIRSGIANTRA